MTLPLRKNQVAPRYGEDDELPRWHPPDGEMGETDDYCGFLLLRNLGDKVFIVNCDLDSACHSGYVIILEGKLDRTHMPYTWVT